jgi:hypothetical protein
MGRAGEAAAVTYLLAMKVGAIVGRLDCIHPYTAITQSTYRISIRKLCTAVEPVRHQLPYNLVSISKIRRMVYTITSIDVYKLI